ncbi:DUF6242 domain-containing protein [Saccharicrinis sp. FJH54]|uniref:DUF6242 domain-containing protein n=1 Tax=Saccharicrinis sp. FJH54 TaxID=3344665 RepID=UPI0035D4400B
MTNTKLWTLLLMTAVTITLTSCFDTVTYSNKGELTTFYIPDQRNALEVSNIEFTITQPVAEGDTGLITNLFEIFPYGSLKDPLKPVFSAEGQAGIYWEYHDSVEIDSVTKIDSVFSVPVTSGSTSIDFSDKVLLKVLSEDGNRLTPYYVEINADTIYPGSVTWTQLSDSIQTGLTPYSETFYLNGKMYLLSGNIDPETDEVYSTLYSSEDGNTWINVSIRGDFPNGVYHTVKVFNGKAYIIGYIGWDSGSKSFTAKEEIWSSSDGLNWTKSDYPVGMHSVFKNAGVFNNELVVWGGSSLNASSSTLEAMPYTVSGTVPEPDYTVWYFNGSVWIQGADMPNEMAVRFSTSCVFEDHGLVYGGELADGSNSGLFWSLEDNANWLNFPKSELETFSYATLLSFDRNLWLFGGVNEAGITNHTVQISLDGGLTFKTEEDEVEGNLFPGSGYLARAKQNVIMTPDHTVYVIGGENITFAPRAGNENVSVNQLYDSWKGIMKKYANE